MLKFPENFLWGSSTSSHQVEGGNINDWSKWEEKKSAGWGIDPYVSGRACDHYNRFEEDFDIARSLNQNAHRFSIEWSRVEPEEGKFNQEEIEHYRRVVFALRERNIEPFLTLYHWTLPLWFAKEGGWLGNDSIGHFSRYVEKMVEVFGEDVKFWITLNEPFIYSSNSFLKGKWPPQEKSSIKAFRVLNKLIDAHERAYEILHQKGNLQIGIAKNCVYFDGNLLRHLARYVFNEYFLNRISQDFIGLNYYFHNRIRGLKHNQNDNKVINDLGWEIYPEGIYHILEELGKYKKPIYVTENGVADSRDALREKFIFDHLCWIHRAIEKGVDVRGYFHWSLLDNFEWDKGLWPRFGLIEMNYETMERKIRSSARFYADVCRTNSLNL